MGVIAKNALESSVTFNQFTDDNIKPVLVVN